MKSLERLSNIISNYWRKGKVEKGIVIILGIVLWPLILIFLILNQKWGSKFKLALIAAVLVIWLFSPFNIFRQSSTATIPAPSPESSQQGGCVGPDGKHIQLDPINCQKFNDAWKKQQTTETPGSISNSPTPSPKPKTTLTPTLAPTQVKKTVNQSIPSTSSETVSQRNAVIKAKSYLAYTSFSHDGLVDQLVYEQFSHDDAVYGADNSGANWDEQAAKKAKSYMEYSAFSRGSLIDQLKYDKFTQEQAEYGTNAVGL